MKYNIVIDYIDGSAKDKTAKFSLTDENGDFILKDAPVSMPIDAFNKNKAASYFSLNQSSPKIRRVDFSDTSVIHDFYDKPKFAGLTEFNDEDEKGNKIFFSNENKKYIVHNRSILFFPQKNGVKLGVDKKAFILHQSDYNKLLSVFKDQEPEFSFLIRRKKFSLLSIFDANFADRDFSKVSNINKAYLTLKELWQKKKLFSPDTSGVVAEKLKAASKKIMSKLLNDPSLESKKSLNVEPLNPEYEISENETKSFPEDHSLETPHVEQKQDEYKPNLFEQQTHYTAGNALFSSKTDLGQILHSAYNGANADRLISPEFLSKFYIYFSMQALEINGRNIHQALNSIDGGEQIRGVSFMSNENGFFAQLFADEEKKFALGGLSFDFGSNTMVLKNESCSITLKEDEENHKLMKFTADYGDVSFKGSVLHRISANSHKSPEQIIDHGSSLISFNTILGGQIDLTPNGVLLNHDLTDIGQNKLLKMSTQSTLLLDNEQVFDFIKNGTDPIYDYSNFKTLSFEGKNEELYKLSQMLDSSKITEEDLESVEPNTRVLSDELESSNLKDESVALQEISNEPHNKVDNEELDNENIPTATNNISPFPPDYVRIMEDHEFDDKLDRTVGVDMVKIKHQFLTNDPKLTKIDITALEYEYFYKPFKEDRLRAAKQAEIDLETNRQMQVLELFKSQDIEDQISFLVTLPVEKRKEMFISETDPLLSIIQEQSPEKQVQILSPLGLEKATEILGESNNELLLEVSKHIEATNEEVKQEQKLEENNEDVQKIETPPVSQENIKEESVKNEAPEDNDLTKSAQISNDKEPDSSNISNNEDGVTLSTSVELDNIANGDHAPQQDNTPTLSETTSETTSDNKKQDVSLDNNNAQNAPHEEKPAHDQAPLFDVDDQPISFDELPPMDLDMLDNDDPHFVQKNESSGSTWGSLSNQDIPIEDLPFDESELSNYGYSGGMNLDVPPPPPEAYPPLDIYCDEDDRDYSGSSIHEPQDFENCYPEQFDPSLTLQNDQPAQDVSQKDDHKLSEGQNKKSSPSNSRRRP